MAAGKFHLMRRGKWIFTTGLATLIWVLCGVRSDFELCNPDQSQTVFKFTHANCPHGVLFDHPVTAFCMGSSDSPETYITDLCDPENGTLDLNVKPYQIQLAIKVTEGDIDTADACQGEGPGKCNVTEYTEATLTTFTEPGGTGCDPDEEEEDDFEMSDEERARRTDVQVANQTERLFKFMLGLTVEKDEDGPNLRVVKILKQSFKILGKFCDSRYVPIDFGQDVLQAFLFLFREANQHGFKDIPMDDYAMIKKTLDTCEMKDPPFNLTGQICKTCANVHSIEKNGKSKRYMRDEFSFQWGKYDVPVDATYSVVNFVHGLCYGTYSRYVNKHHLYQIEMERLFLPPIIYRWTRPVIIQHEDLWDHIFSATVKNAMKNLDACVSAAYFDTPFLHRLERPLPRNDTDELDKKKERRKKRSIPTMLLDDGGLEGAGWCFQSEEDMLMTTEAYVNIRCPENREKIIDYIKTTLKEEEEPAEPPSTKEDGVDGGLEVPDYVVPPPNTDAEEAGGTGDFEPSE